MEARSLSHIAKLVCHFLNVQPLLFCPRALKDNARANQQLNCAEEEEV